MVDFFSKGGKLGAAKGYEPRPGQATMAGKVAEVIEGKKHLVVEAGTGTGKSLAYLVPAAYAAEELGNCLLYTSPSPRDRQKARMPSSA